MITARTRSEKLFESFLAENGVPFERVKEGEEPTPDYEITIGNGVKVLFEIKELGEVKDFSPQPGVVHSRTPGDHIRRKIQAARGQMKSGAAAGRPSILLIYNIIDPCQAFGTEDHDFTTAMYGELTIVLNKESRQPVDLYHGRNQSCAEDKNTSFSAVGRLWPVHGKLHVMLFENVFSKVKIPYEILPACFEVTRIELTQ